MVACRLALVPTAAPKRSPQAALRTGAPALIVREVSSHLPWTRTHAGLDGGHLSNERGDAVPSGFVGRETVGPEGECEGRGDTAVPVQRQGGGQCSVPHEDRDAPLGNVDVLREELRHDAWISEPGMPVGRNQALKGVHGPHRVDAHEKRPGLDSPGSGVAHIPLERGHPAVRSVALPSPGIGDAPHASLSLLGDDLLRVYQAADSGLVCALVCGALAPRVAIGVATRSFLFSRGGHVGGTGIEGRANATALGRGAHGLAPCHPALLVGGILEPPNRTVMQFFGPLELFLEHFEVGEAHGELLGVHPGNLPGICTKLGQATDYARGCSDGHGDRGGPAAALRSLSFPLGLGIALLRLLAEDLAGELGVSHGEAHVRTSMRKRGSTPVGALPRISGVPPVRSRDQ